MRVIFALIVAIVIVWLMSMVTVFLNAMVDSAQQGIDEKFLYVLVGLIPIIPLILAIWLIRISWGAIVHSDKNTNRISETKASKDETRFSQEPKDSPEPELKRYEHEAHQTKSNNTSSESVKPSKPLKRLE